MTSRADGGGERGREHGWRERDGWMMGVGRNGRIDGWRDRWMD